MPTTWQSEFFRDIALDMWRAVIPNLPTRAETDFLARIFSADDYSARPLRLLDLACGNGRHALALAARGFDVTGVDLSPEFIEEAKAHAGERVRFIHADLLDLPPALAEPGDFDGAYCFGNSIGYFDRNDLAALARSLAGQLKTGAAFVIDTGVAAESILPSMPKGRWFKLGDLFMLSEHRYSPREGRLDIDYTFIRDGLVVTRPASSFVLTVAEISRVFADAGFAVADALASPEGEPFTLGSPRLLLVARRV